MIYIQTKYFKQHESINQPNANKRHYGDEKEDVYSGNIKHDGYERSINNKGRETYERVEMGEKNVIGGDKETGGREEISTSPGYITHSDAINRRGVGRGCISGNDSGPSNKILFKIDSKYFKKTTNSVERLCSHNFIKGKRAGRLCDMKVDGNTDYCIRHHKVDTRVNNLIKLMRHHTLNVIYERESNFVFESDINKVVIGIIEDEKITDN